MNGHISNVNPDLTVDLIVSGVTIPHVRGFKGAVRGMQVNYASGVATPVGPVNVFQQTKFEHRQIRVSTTKTLNYHINPSMPNSAMDLFSAFFMLVDRAEIYPARADSNQAFEIDSGFLNPFGVYLPRMPNAGNGLSNHFYNDESHLSQSFLPDHASFVKIDDRTIDVTQLNPGFNTTWSRTQRTYINYNQYHTDSERVSYGATASGVSPADAEANVGAIMFSNAKLNEVQQTNAATLAVDVPSSGTMPHAARLIQAYMADIAALLPPLVIGQQVPNALIDFCVIQEIVLDARIFKGSVVSGAPLSLVTDNPGYYVGIEGSDFFLGVCNAPATRGDFVRIKVAYLAVPAALHAISTTIKVEPFISSGVCPYVVTGSGPSEKIHSMGHYALHTGTIVFADEAEYRSFNLAAPSLLYTSTKALDNFQSTQPPSTTSNEFFRSRPLNWEYFKSIWYPNPPENSYGRTDAAIFGSPDEVTYASAAGGGFMLPNVYGVIPETKQSEGWYGAPTNNDFGNPFGSDNGLPAIIRPAVDYDNFASLEPYCHAITIPYHYLRSHIPWGIVMASPTIPPIQPMENISVWHSTTPRVVFNPDTSTYDTITPNTIPIYIELPPGSTPVKSLPTTTWGFGIPPLLGPGNTAFYLSSLTPFKTYTDSYANTIWYQRYATGGNWVRFSEGPFGIFHDYHVTTTGSGSSWTATATDTMKWQGTNSAAALLHGTKYNGIDIVGTATADFTLELHVYRVKIHIPPLDASRPEYGLVTNPFTSVNSLLCNNRININVGTIAPLTGNLPTDLGFYPPALAGFEDPDNVEDRAIYGSIRTSTSAQLKFTFLPPDRPFGKT